MINGSLCRSSLPVGLFADDCKVDGSVVLIAHGGSRAVYGSMTVMAEILGAEVPQLGRLEPVDPRSIWSHEALNFTPWLAHNADRLADALGIELAVEATEYAVGGYSLDIFGRPDKRRRAGRGESAGRV